MGKSIVLDKHEIVVDRDHYEKLVETLTAVAAWDLPSTDKFWDAEKTRPVPYEVEHGSFGIRWYFQDLARQALTGVGK